LNYLRDHVVISDVQGVSNVFLVAKLTSIA